MSFNKTLQQNNKKHIKPVIIHFKPTTGHDLQLSPVILCRKRRLTWVACVTKTGSEIGIVISLTRKTEQFDFTIQLGYVLRGTILQAKKKKEKKKTDPHQKCWCQSVPCTPRSCFSHKCVWSTSSPYGEVNTSPYGDEVEIERFLYALYFTITTFRLHAFFFTCLCLPSSSFSLFLKTPVHSL